LIGRDRRGVFLPRGGYAASTILCAKTIPTKSGNELRTNPEKVIAIADSLGKITKILDSQAISSL